MAKPKTAGYSQSPATSSTSHRHSQHNKSGSRPPNPSPNLGPSSTLLALLATVVGSSSTADGHPLPSESSPPDFLCPILIADSTTATTPRSRSNTLRAKRDSGLDTSPFPRLNQWGRRYPFVPDKYEQGEDGRWRKSGSWTLYGSSYCKCADTAKDTSIPIVDDQVKATQIASTSDPPPEPTMDSSLPPGWSSPSKEDHILTSIILALSLVLAILICVFMMGCIRWRKKHRLSLQKDLGDLENKLRKGKGLGGNESDEESEEIKKMRSQQRLWSKATARWKANVRMSARRRRRKRLAQSGDNDEDISPRMSSVSLTSSHPTSSLTAHRDETVASSTSLSLTDLSHSNDEHSSSGSSVNGSHHPNPRTSRPPAYNNDPTNAQSMPKHPERSHSSEDIGADPSSDFPTTQSEERIPYIAPLDSAHVATDDKGILARMAALASAPPADSSSTSQMPERGQSSETSRPSVPVLEEYEDSSIDLVGLDQGDYRANWAVPSASELTFSPSLSVNPPAPSYSPPPPAHPFFPSPPSKARLAAPLFYEYPSAFEEDVISSEPAPEPSAPPFEATVPTVPSAPPTDDDSYDVTQVVPCAPPLPDEDDQLELIEGGAAVSASAPPLEDENSTLSSSAGSSFTLSLARRPSTSTSMASVERSSSSALDPPGYLP